MKRRTLEQDMFQEFTASIVTRALLDPALAKARGTFKVKGAAAQTAVKKLVELGCEEDLLLDSFAFAKMLPELYRKADVGTLVRITKTIGSLLEDMRLYFPHPNLITVLDLPDNEQRLEYVQLLLSKRAEEELEQLRASMIKMTEQARRGRIPQTDQIWHLAYLWPVFYVHSVTKRPHYPEVATILKDAGLGVKDESQLSKAVGVVRQRSPEVEGLLVLWLPSLSAPKQSNEEILEEYEIDRKSRGRSVEPVG